MACLGPLAGQSGRPLGLCYHALAHCGYAKFPMSLSLYYLLNSPVMGIMDTSDACRQNPADSLSIGSLNIETTGTMFNGDEWGIAAGLSSLLTNMFATILIACRAWCVHDSFMQDLTAHELTAGARYCTQGAPPHHHVLSQSPGVFSAHAGGTDTRAPRRVWAVVLRSLGEHRAPSPGVSKRACSPAHNARFVQVFIVAYELTVLFTSDPLIAPNFARRFYYVMEGCVVPLIVSIKPYPLAQIAHVSLYALGHVSDPRPHCLRGKQVTSRDVIRQGWRMERGVHNVCWRPSRPRSRNTVGVA